MESPGLNLVMTKHPNKDPRLTLPNWTADYVEITDDILLQTDPYWGLSSSVPSTSDASSTEGGACWNVPSKYLAKNDFADPPGFVGTSSHAAARFKFCQSVYGSPGTNPDASPSRDLPILQAYKDHLVVGRFNFPGQLDLTVNRTVDAGSDLNPARLELMACCFHSQASFKVRTGGEWVAVGQNSVGLLHHVVAEPSSDPATSRCRLSCDPRDVLLNARSFDVPWAAPGACTSSASPVAIGRNSVLAMRNPMFSYVTWSGCGPLADPVTDHTLTARDLTWKFSDRRRLLSAHDLAQRQQQRGRQPPVDALHRLARAARRRGRRAAGSRAHRFEHGRALEQLLLNASLLSGSIS